MNKNEQNYVIPTVVEESHDGMGYVNEISRFRCASLEMTIGYYCFVASLPPFSLKEK
jgi:hypothetical protein